MKIKVPNAVTSRFARQMLVAQKNSPTLLFVGGVAGVVATTVLACRATLKVDEALDEIEKKKTLAKEAREDHADVYSATDYKKDMSFLYVQSVVKITKLYGPAILVGAASIAALTGAHNILNKRNAALTAAYAAVEKGFREYRDRVVSEYGDDKDREFRYGARTETIVEDTPKGPKKVDVTRVGTTTPSIYARFFDELNVNWQSEREFNLMFLRAQQEYANQKLHARGHVFLNEIYDALGFPRTQAGQVVGWTTGKDPNKDRFIDFGIWDHENQKARDFVNGREGAILLEFNVDGIVFDEI